MTKEGFVDAIKLVVTEGTENGIKENLLEPPGRQPAIDSIEMSTWYLNLPIADQEMLMRVVDHTAEFNTFSFLCVLDGVSAIESSQSKGKLTLTYQKDGVSVVVNRYEDPFLHDLL